MKNINNFNQWKNASVDATFTRTITHQKHLAQSAQYAECSGHIQYTPRIY